MIAIRPGGALVMCDETLVDGRCVQALRVDFSGDLSSAVDAARNSGWRVYAQNHRRDLCPTHRNAARRRLTLIIDGKAA